MTPRTPDFFPGVREDEGLILLDEGYGVPQAKGGFRYSDGYLYAKDEYGVFNIRTYVHPHIATHLGGGNDTFYEVTNRDPTVNDDSYDVGHRWINLSDSYEFVLADNTLNNALWLQTTNSGGLPGPHAPTHIHNGTDQVDGDKLNIDFDPSFYSQNTTPSEVNSPQELTAHLAGIDAYFGDLDGYYLDPFEHRTLRHLIHFVNEGPGGGFASGATKEIYPQGDPFPTQVVWKTADGNKLVEKLITRDSRKQPTTIIWNMYDTNGITILSTITDTITYSGIFEILRTRGIS